MRWSWRIGEFAGIGVYIHATFFLIVGWVALLSWQQEHTAIGVLSGIAYVLLLFLCVVLHEYGHALTARRYGIRTRDITLLPIGGVARLERMPDNPIEELYVALAGPAVNVVIALLLLVGLTWTNGDADVIVLFDPNSDHLAERLLTTNVMLVLFNLLPAFPMDGGRVVRALLATRMDYTRATQIAASLGQAMALLFAFAGLLYQPFLLFIAFFVWIGASQEANLVQLKSALHGIPVRNAMLTSFRVMSPFDTLEDAIRLTLAGSQKDFPVMEEGNLVGILTQEDLLTGLTQQGRDVPVQEVMHTDFETVTPTDMLHSLFVRMQDSACDCRTMPVMVDGRLVGIVTKENIGEFLEIQAALTERSGSNLRRQLLKG
ncbi:MAG: site-2 protease family protein [candidate division Zixibacteria bacterium]|nr:site-2 protease family protein [candidate division Zixibacteria bacterium]